MFPSGGNVILQRNHHKHHLNTITLAIVAIIAGVASVNNRTYTIVIIAQHYSQAPTIYTYVSCLSH